MFTAHAQLRQSSRSSTQSFALINKCWLLGFSLLATVATVSAACSDQAAMTMPMPTADAGDTSDAASGPPPTITVKSNQLLPGYPHAIDMYVPSNAESAVIFLHGGGGKKENFENDLGLKTDTSTTDFSIPDTGKAWLTGEKVLAIFPQGQTLSGYNAWTWNNYVMASGQDDAAFLAALVSSLRTDPSLPRVSKFYLVGHSNGGMMAQRLWCESPSTFDGFGALAGPPSIHLDPTRSASATEHPCKPTTTKPYISIIGDTDKVLATGGKMADATWVLNPILSLGRPPTWVDSVPTVLNDKLFHNTRTSLKCGGSPSAPVVTGQLTTYSDCNNTVQLIVVAQTQINGTPTGGDHCLSRLSGPCITTLAGATGLDYKSAVVDFFQRQ